MTSRLRDFESRYTSRISEYVIPPAMNTSRRCLFSCVAPGRAARCQLGLALRREAEPVEFVVRRLGAAVSVGWSLT